MGNSLAPSRIPIIAFLNAFRPFGISFSCSSSSGSRVSMSGVRGFVLWVFSLAITFCLIGSGFLSCGSCPVLRSPFASAGILSFPLRPSVLRVCHAFQFLDEGLLAPDFMHLRRHFVFRRNGRFFMATVLLFLALAHPFYFSSRMVPSYATYILLCWTCFCSCVSSSFRHDGESELLLNYAQKIRTPLPLVRESFTA